MIWINPNPSFRLISEKAIGMTKNLQNNLHNEQ